MSGSQATLAVVPEKAALIGEDEKEAQQHANDTSAYPKYGNSGKMLTCLCPPDADLPNLNLRDFR